MKYKQNGSYNLKKLNLLFDDGVSINLIPLMLDVTLFESMFSISMSGNVSIMDSTGLFNENFLGNGERIEIDFETAGSDVSIKYTGIVYKTSPPTRINEHTSGLLLHFCSPQMIESTRTVLTRGYEKEISKIVEDIHKQISPTGVGNKPFDVVPTKEIHKIVCASQQPFEMIPQLARRAVSKQGSELGYLYFENNREWVFAPIERLMGGDAQSEYVYKNAGVFKNVDKRIEESFNSIQNYEIVEFPDMLKQIEDGIYGSQVVNVDIVDKTIRVSEYDNRKNFQKSRSLGKHPNLVESLLNKNNTDSKEVFYHDTQKPFEQYRHKNLIALMNSQKYIAKISVFGDTTITAGSVIKCSLPVWGSDQKRNDPFSGRALITEIKHTLKKTEYVQTFKLIKDAFNEGKA